MGDVQVKYWLISLLITILTGIFVTQPIQVIEKIFSEIVLKESKTYILLSSYEKIFLMTLLLIVWLRRYDNSQDLSVDENPFIRNKNQDNYQVNKIIYIFSLLHTNLNQFL